MLRPLYFAAGWLLFGLGTVGIIIPILPTTPFMLLALWAFSKSSRRFHDWLLNHDRFGPPLTRWKEKGAISTRIKVYATTTMLLSCVIIIFYVKPDIWILITTITTMSLGAWFILSRPSR